MITGPAVSQVAMLGPQVRMMVENELAAGEKVLWIGQPSPGSFSRGMGSIAMVLFSIPWTAFSLFWTFMASGGFWGLLGKGRGFGPSSGEGPFKYFNVCFGLFGVPFILIGLGMMTSPLWMRRKARRTAYAVTDKRVILWEAGFFGSYKITSYPPDRLGAIERTQRPDGSGDLILERTEWRDREGDRRSSRKGLIGIAEVKKVEELIRKHLANT